MSSKETRVTKEYVFSICLFILVHIAALFTIVWIFKDVVWQIRMEPQKLLEIKELALLVGFMVLFFVSIRSLVSDFLRLFSRERRIVCGAGQKGTRYDIRRLISGARNNIEIVAQNMKTLLSIHDFLPNITKQLNAKPNLRVHFTLTTFDAMRAISAPPQTHLHQRVNVNNKIAAELHYKESVEQICTFMRELDPNDRNRFSVSFHPGASSLSAIVIDSNSTGDSQLVFTPKWTVDAQPDNRLFCVLRRADTPDLFNLLNGTISRLKQNDSLTLNQVANMLGIPLDGEANG